MGGELVFGVIVALLMLNFLYSQWFSSRRLPPGPKPLPILGNITQMPQEYSHVTFAEWGKAYGDVLYVQLLHKPTLILNSLAAVQDLFDKRSAKYSDRPRMVMLVELAGWEPDVAFLPYGETFRKHRKWIHASLLDKAALASYMPNQRKETVNFLSGLIEQPDEFRIHIKRFTAAIILAMTYGHTVNSIDDELVVISDLAGEGTTRTGPAGATFVDFFPILKYVPAWLPGAGWKRHALYVRCLVRDVFEKPFAMVQVQLTEGRAKPSIVSSLIEETSRKGTLEQEKEHIMGVGAVLYGAGTDTTSTVLLTFFLVMTLYPHVYRKAQEEIDRVIGFDRLPEFSDRESLPYLECLLQETYRWNCPVPLGVAHRLMEDDEYRGYHMPKGSVVIPNMWQMTQDSEIYPHPENFRPEQFQEMDAATAGLADPRIIVFGHGRRICPGRHFADSSIWFVMASVLSVFDIQPSKDASGKPAPPKPPLFMSGFVSHPNNFTCSITLRSQKAADLVAQSKAHF